jgi:hypothetical protein
MANERPMYLLHYQENSTVQNSPRQWITKAVTSSISTPIAVYDQLFGILPSHCCPREIIELIVEYQRRRLQYAVFRKERLDVLHICDLDNLSRPSTYDWQLVAAMEDLRSDAEEKSCIGLTNPYDAVYLPIRLASSYFGNFSLTGVLPNGDALVSDYTQHIHFLFHASTLEWTTFTTPHRSLGAIIHPSLRVLVILHGYDSGRQAHMMNLHDIDSGRLLCAFPTYGIQTDTPRLLATSGKLIIEN